MKLSPFKIKIENKNHSRKIQEFLFSLGHSWWDLFGGHSQEDKNLDGKYLICSRIDSARAPSFLSTTSAKLFDSVDIPEKWFYDGKLQDGPEIVGDPRSHLMWLPGTYEDIENIEHKNSDGEWKPFVFESGYRIKLKPKPRYCNGIELDECIKEPLEIGVNYYLANPFNSEYNSSLNWGGREYEIRNLDRGFVYINKKSAIKHGKAMGKASECPFIW